MKTVIYWVTKDRALKKKLMDELNVRYTSVNGESVYDGDVERLREYEMKGIIKIRQKYGRNEQKSL